MRQKLNNFCDEMKHMKTNINKHCTANGLNVNTEFGANMNKQHRLLTGLTSVTTIGLLISALFISGISQAEEAVATDAVKEAVVEPAVASTVAEPTLNAAKDRITDQAIRADQATYTATQARIRALNETGIPVADYNLSKAQCWLDAVSYTHLDVYKRQGYTNGKGEAGARAKIQLSEMFGVFGEAIRSEDRALAGEAVRTGEKLGVTAKVTDKPVSYTHLDVYKRQRRRHAG